MVRVVKDRLLRQGRLGRQADRRSGVQVAAELREAGAGHLQSDPVPFLEDLRIALVKNLLRQNPQKDSL